MIQEMQTRRRFVRLAAIGAGGLILPNVVDRRPVDASRVWCRKDPDVLLEGTFLRIEVAVPEEHLPLVNGPTWLQFNIPAGVDREFVWADSGFNDLGYDIGFSTYFLSDKWVSKFSVSLTIKVPISDETRVPIWCCAAPASGNYVERTGPNANAGIALNFAMHGTP